MWATQQDEQEKCGGHTKNMEGQVDSLEVSQFFPTDER